MYIYDFLNALQLYPIDASQYPLDALYLGIYSHDEIIQQNIPCHHKHHHYLVYAYNQDIQNLHAIAIDEEMRMIQNYQDYQLILPRKTTIHLDEAILEALRLYDEFVKNDPSPYIHTSLQYPSHILASMLYEAHIDKHPSYAYFAYNPIIYQLAYERFLYFIKLYCYYRLKTDRQGYPVKNFLDILKSNIGLYTSNAHDTYHIYTLTHIENKEYDLFLSQISKI